MGNGSQPNDLREAPTMMASAVACTGAASRSGRPLLVWNCDGEDGGRLQIDECINVRSL
ncbi:hypothetical protein Dimus_014736, partial [Dionaea muscipula]